MCKRLIVIVLSLILLAALFTGCAKSQTPSSETPAPATETPSAPEPETSDPATAAETQAPEAAQPEAALEAAPEESPAAEPVPAQEAEPPAPAELEEPAPAERSGPGVELDPQNVTNEEIITNISNLDRSIYPIADGEEISMATPFGTDMYADLPNGYASCLVPQLVNEITGVTLNWVEYSGEAWTEQFHLMVAGGDYTDLCSTQQAYTGGEDNGVEDDFILPLEDYLEEYMPNYYECLYGYPEENFYKLITTEEGHIPGLAQFSLSSGAVEQNLGLYWIRTDYMEQAGLSTAEEDLPQTYDEWYEVLTAFKSIGVVEPAMIPSYLVNNNEGLVSGYNIAGNASVTPTGSHMPFYVVDGQVKFGIVEPEYEDFLQMLHQWYSEGLIGEDFFTKNQNIKDPAFIATIVNGDAGIFFEDQMDVETVMGQAKELNPDFAIHALRDPMMERGQTNHFGTGAASTARTSCWVTTAAAQEGEEHLRVVLGWADFWYTETGSDLATWGPEGVTFVYDENGSHQLTEFGDRILAKNESLTMKFSYSNNLFGALNRESIDSNTEFLKAAILYRLDCDIDSDYTLPSGVKLDADESYEFTAMYTDISTLLEENILKFITGAKDFGEYDQFISDLYSMGIQDCIDIYQVAYERYLEKD